MCEAKTKKHILAVFLIPLVALLVSFIHVATNSQPTYAVDCTAAQLNNSTSTYSVAKGASSIVETTKSYQSTNPGTSFGSCVQKTTTETYTQNPANVLQFAVGGATNTDSNSCGNTITFVANPVAGQTTIGTLQRYTKQGFYCQKSGATEDAHVAVATGAALKTENVDTTTGDGNTQVESNCAIPGGIGWFVCPIANTFAGFTDGLYGFVSDIFLSTSPSVVANDSGTHTAWQSVLAIANVAFVIIFLIIIFSQATGYGISNYGIKKMLPKIIIGVVLINLSYFLCQIAVDVSNILGYGIRGFFKNLGTNQVTWATIVKDILVTQFTGAAAGAVLLTGVIALNTGLGIGALLACVITLLFIVLFLIARQVLIIMCVVIAPVAFAAWLLPNTERFFKFWWKIFYTMLIVFPLASLVVGASDLASEILSNALTSGDQGAANATTTGAIVNTHRIVDVTTLTERSN